MRNFRVLTCLFCAVIFGLISCQTDTPVSEEKPHALSPASPTIHIIDSIGILHNQTAEYVYTKLDSARHELIAVDTTIAFEWLTRDFIIEYFDSHVGIDVSAHADTSLLGPNLLLDFSDIPSYFGQSVSRQADSLLTEMDHIIDAYIDDSISHSAFINAIMLIKITASALASSGEAIAVGSAASVLLNSVAYWDTHDELWSELWVPPSEMKLPTVQLPNKKQKETVKSDAMGALTGAIEGSVGGPWGAAIGAMFFGAAASIKTAYEQKVGRSMIWWPFAP